MKYFTALKNVSSYYLVSALLLVGFYKVGHTQTHTPQRLKSGAIMLENFENDQVGQLPEGWYDRDGNKQLKNHEPDERAKYKYRVRQENGNKFLQYEGQKAMHINFPLIDDQKDNIYDINIYKTPILSWKVRAYDLPENANENDNSRNDAVASVYVVFDMGHVLFKKVPKSIRYSWSSTLKEGTELSKFFGNQKIVVVESGPARTGKWITFERNIVKDYRRLFGDNPPKNPMAILILSDGDSTGSFVKAEYDDIMLKPER